MIHRILSGRGRTAGIVATIAILASSTGLSTSACASEPSKLSPDLISAMKPGIIVPSVSIPGLPVPAGISSPASKPTKLRVIVRLARTKAQLRMLTRRHAAQLPMFGGTPFGHLGLELVTATPNRIREIAADPNVASISIDRHLKISQQTSTLSSTNGTAAILDVNGPSVGADISGSQTSGSPYLTGSGVTVAVLDSGVAPVDDIKNHIVAFADFVNGQTAPYDDNGHGTHVAGIVAGDGTDSSVAGAVRTYKGIAPGAGIVAVKVTDANGDTSASTVIAGIDWCIENQAAYNIRVINLSLGGAVLESYKTDPICQAAEQAVSAGIVVVAAAGNYGGSYGYITSPGNDPSVITVGASNSEQSTNRSLHRITSYTSRGPTIVDRNVKPDLIAPGNKIVSLRVPGSTIDVTDSFAYVDPSEYLSGDTSTVATSYTRLSGTSMAAPAVSGAVAIMLQENPGLYPNGVKLALMYSAQLLKGYDPVLNATITYDPFTEGAGELNIPGAAQLASKMGPAGLSGSPSLNSTIGGVQFSWFAATVADHLSITGSPSNTFWGSPTVWSSPAIWTNSLTWGGDEDFTSDGTAFTGQSLTWGGDEDIAWGGVQSLTWGGDEDFAESIVLGQSLTWGGDESLTWGGDESLTWGGDESLTWGGDEDYTSGDTTSQSLTWGGDEDIADAQAVLTGDS